MDMDLRQSSAEAHLQYELKIDKELESLCPALSADELRLLEESIAADGCRDEIVLWANHDKTVIDGHNRYRICEKLKKPYKTLSLAFDSRDEVKLWMLRNQMGRRNLTDGQRAMMAARIATIGNGKHKQAAQICAAPTQAEAAKEAGVSRRTVQSAKQVIEQGTPELQKLVTDGELAVSVAAEVAKKPAKEQKKIVAKGPKAVAASAKESRAAAKSEPLPEIVPIDPNGFDPANIEAHNESFAANFAAKVKQHNLEIERFARSIMEAFADPPASVWLDESRLGIAMDQIKSACATIRQAKAHDKPCPKCSGNGSHTGKPCKWCHGVGYMPERSYEMAGGQ